MVKTVLEIFNYSLLTINYSLLKIFDFEYTGGIAQLGEHLPCKQGVSSSNLLISIGQNQRFCQLDFDN